MQDSNPRSLVLAELMVIFHITYMTNPAFDKDFIWKPFQIPSVALHGELFILFPWCCIEL
ncbi:hypothetical protein M5K25_002770 [Dendrobium thyrsiflorum]|uniref:Uncharacterized protein n=1 Tax=Dendrobium thyrsiflorum TaxID=117978 RepID=A0ABD0VUQ7_DENTH